MLGAEGEGETEGERAESVGGLLSSLVFSTASAPGAAAASASAAAAVGSADSTAAADGAATMAVL